jgi:hypothetical protein
VTPPPADNFLYYGDNLDILRRYLKDDSVDLVYLDPLFKSNQDYNVLFAEQSGTGGSWSNRGISVGKRKGVPPDK